MTTWNDALVRLLALAAWDLEDGYPPRPSLAAYTGDDCIAVVGLRPFGPGELAGPLLELAALFLPLGADRFALGVPGRAWSLDDPIPPVVDEIDLRQTVLTVLLVDGHERTEPHVDGLLCSYGRDEHGVARFGEPTTVGWPDGPATDMFRTLVTHRHEVPMDADAAQPVVQFARCMLKGHNVILAPDVAEHLELLTGAPR